MTASSMPSWFSRSGTMSTAGVSQRSTSPFTSAFMVVAGSGM